MTYLSKLLSRSISARGVVIVDYLYQVVGVALVGGGCLARLQMDEVVEDPFCKAVAVFQGGTGHYHPDVLPMEPMQTASITGAAGSGGSQGPAVGSEITEVDICEITYVLQLLSGTQTATFSGYQYF